MNVTVTKERYVEMFQKIFPEDSLDISTFERVCVHAGWSTGTHIEDGYEVVEGSLSRETDLAEVRIQLVPTFTRSEPLKFLSFGLYERLDQQKIIPATISQVKQIIELIPAEILQCVIGEFSRRIRNCIVAR